VARWVFAAELPMVLALLASVFRLLGWADLPFVPQYAVVLALAIEVPLLLVALLIRTRDRHGAEVRAQALSTQDALTGLLAPHLFTDRLQQAVTRFRRDGEAIQESLAAQLARMSPRTRPPSASSSPSRRLRRNREIRRCSRKPIPATTRATPRSASRTGSSRARAGRRAASLPCRRR
jgi:hypothetical protein